MLQLRSARWIFSSRGLFLLFPELTQGFSRMPKWDDPLAKVRYDCFKNPGKERQRNGAVLGNPVLGKSGLDPVFLKLK